MRFARISLSAALLVTLACAPKGPAPKQCAADTDCFSGGACNAGGTCVIGAAIDKDKSAIEISQPTAVANGVDEVTITVTLRDPDGKPLSSRGVRLAVDGASNNLIQPSLSTNSVGQVVGKLTSTKAETKTITAVGGVVIGNAASPGVALTKAATVTFVADASHPACAAGTTGSNCVQGNNGATSTVAVTGTDGVSAPDVQVDPVNGVKIVVKLKDANGNPVGNVPVNFNVIGAVRVTLTPASGSGATGTDGTFTGNIASTLAQSAAVIVDVAGFHLVKAINFHAAPFSPADSTVTLTVGGTECDNSGGPTCTIAADGSSGPVDIQMLVHDQYGNLVKNAPVWFSNCVPVTDPSTGATTCDPESDATIATNQAELDYCAAKTPAANCEALQNAPLLTLDDGTVRATFASPHAGAKTVTAHLGPVPLDLPITVVAGAPDSSMSQFVLIPHPAGAQDGSPVIADGVDTYLVGVYLADKFNNPVAGKPISFSTCIGSGCTPAATPGPGDALFEIQSGGLTDQDGLYEALYSGTKADVRTVQANGVPSGVTTAQPAVFAPGEAATVALSIGAATACAGVSTSAPTYGTCADPDHPVHLAALVKDAHGNITAYPQELTIDAKIGGAAGTSCTACNFTFPSFNAATGVYSADFAASLAGPLTVTADVVTANKTTIHAETPLTISPGAVSTASSSVALDPATTSPLTANGVATLKITVTVKDNEGNPIPGKAILVGISPGTSVASLNTTATNPAGVSAISIASNAAETETVTAVVPGAVSTTLGQVQATFVPGAASAANTTLSPPSQTITSTNTAQLTLTVKDAKNNAVPGIAVSGFTSWPNAGTFAPASGTTDANGQLAVTYRQSTAGAQTIQAQVAGAAFGSTATITVAAGAADPSRSSFAIGTGAGTAGVAQAFTVTLKDSNNNPLIGATFNIACTGATPSVSSGTTSSSGQITGTVSSNTVGTATCTAKDTNGVTVATGTTSFRADTGHIGANPVLTASPTSIPADGTRSTVSLTVKDQFGNLAPGVTVSFTSSATGPKPDTFTCLSSCVTNASGVASAQVSALLTGTHTLTGSVGGQSGSAAIIVTPGAAAALTFKQQPSNLDMSAGGAGPFVMASVKVGLQDANGNDVPGASASITVTLAIPAGAAAGSAGSLQNNVASTGGGIATYNALIPSGTAGGGCDASNLPCRVLVATASGLSSATSSTFQIKPPSYSTGADGVCDPTNASSVCHSATGILPARVYNFTTISIPAGTRLRGDGNGLLDLRAQGAVQIDGVLDVSGGNGGSAGGNGGGFGGGSGNAANGLTGIQDYGTYALGGYCARASDGAQIGCTAGFAGFGYGYNGGGNRAGLGGVYLGGGGSGGGAYSQDQNAGGGGGGGGFAGGAGGFAGADGCVQAGAAGGGSQGGPATGCGATGKGGGQSCAAPYKGGDGITGASACTPIAGSGGGGSIGCDAASDLALLSTFRPGSGGGGGGNGGDSNGEASSGGGGGGGGGGGALRITTPLRIVLGAAGQILARGGNGGNGAQSADDCVDDSGGAGGGGSGGAIWLQAPVLAVPASAVISAAGGAGGAAGATAAAGPGGNGGLGRIRFSYDPAQSSVSGSGVNPPLPGGANGAGKAYFAVYPQ